jgi:hypothetical protein
MPVQTPDAGPCRPAPQNAPQLQYVKEPPRRHCAKVPLAAGGWQPARTAPPHQPTNHYQLVLIYIPAAKWQELFSTFCSLWPSRPAGCVGSRDNPTPPRRVGTLGGRSGDGPSSVPCHPPPAIFHSRLWPQLHAPHYIPAPPTRTLPSNATWQSRLRLVVFFALRKTRRRAQRQTTETNGQDV